MTSEILPTLLAILGVLLFALALFFRLAADNIFRLMEERHPEYYAAKGRPYHGMNLRRTGIGEDMMLRWVYIGIPNDLPADEKLLKQIRLFRRLALYVGFPCIGGFIGIMIYLVYLQ